jgi:hypothetical protein
MMMAVMLQVEKGCCQREFQTLKQCFVKEVGSSLDTMHGVATET